MEKEEERRKVRKKTKTFPSLLQIFSIMQTSHHLVESQWCYWVHWECSEIDHHTSVLEALGTVTTQQPHTNTCTQLTSLLNIYEEISHNWITKNETEILVYNLYKTQILS